MSLDKDDWGSSFGCDPDWHHKKIKSLEDQLQWSIKNEEQYKVRVKSLEESLILAKQQRDVHESNLIYYKRKSEDFAEHIKMLEERLEEKAKRISVLEGNPGPYVHTPS